MRNAAIDQLLPAAAVRKELGGISAVTLWRWETKGVLPPPLKIEGRKYWRRSAIEGFKDAASAPGGVAA